ncbi:MAG: DUF615 domain-containing protein [Rhodoferax sp.]|nr:DUF615 domain-containing protein [Rhodoferax sp.]
MPRKPKKGYFVRGEFVAAGSARDLELKQALRGSDAPSRTELKRESEAAQQLGESLLSLRADLLTALNLPDKLTLALQDARRITDFEGRRRQMQFIGKLMRQLEPDGLAAARAALELQHQGLQHDTDLLHQAETWREQLVRDDGALPRWLAEHPDTDVQSLRALVRQARKDLQAGAPGSAPRQGRAYRDLFRQLRAQLSSEPLPSNPVEP